MPVVIAIVVVMKGNRSFAQDRKVDGCDSIHYSGGLFSIDEIRCATVDTIAETVQCLITRRTFEVADNQGETDQLWSFQAEGSFELTEGPDAIPGPHLCMLYSCCP